MPGTEAHGEAAREGFHLRARVLTCAEDHSLRWLPDARVSVGAQGRLTSVGAFVDGDPVDEDLRAGVLTPGFIDGHVHYPQTRVVGRAAGPLLEWLERVVFPEEARFDEEAYAESVAASFADALARAGTTRALIYGSVHATAADVLHRELAQRGMRGRLGPVLMDRDAPARLCVAPERALEELEALQASWKAEGLELAVLPRFCLSCTPELMRGAGDFARRHELWVSTHLAENEAECAAVQEAFGTSYLQVYEDHGLVGPKSVFAHCVQLSDAEWGRFGESGAVVAHCPDSNDFLGSGTMSLRLARAHGAPLALGSDVAAGRTFSMPKVGAAAYDAALRSGSTLDAAGVFALATSAAAQALRFEDTGRLDAGLWADMVLHDVPPHVEDGAAALDAILFDADRGSVARTWVAGRRVR